MQIVVVVLEVLLLLSTFVVMVAVAAAIVQMLRTKRRQYLLVAIAIFAWALSSWAGIAEFIPFLRDLFGVWTLFTLIALAQLIFIGLTLFVFQHVWGWLFPHRDPGRRDRRD
jgi:hypothetical protein